MLVWMMLVRVFEGSNIKVHKHKGRKSRGARIKGLAKKCNMTK